jgi:hypothetical protein
VLASTTPSALNNVAADTMAVRIADSAPAGSSRWGA